MLRQSPLDFDADVPEQRRVFAELMSAQPLPPMSS